jgi:hypothetical protein
MDLELSPCIIHLIEISGCGLWIQCSYNMDDFDAKWMMLVSSQVSSNGRIEDLDAQWI